MIKAARGIVVPLVVLLAFIPVSVFAQTPPPDPPEPIPSERLDNLIPWPAGDLPAGRGPFSHGLDGVSDPLVSVILQFEGPALAARAVERGRMSAFDQRSYTATLHSRQAEAVSRVQRAGGTVIGQFTKAYNGVQVQVRASELAELRKTSGVKAIHPVRTYYPTLDHSTEIIRADAVWALNGTGYDGEGVTIAVIDTGIDYTHQAFGLDPTFPNDKVIDGYDFAGDSYLGSGTPNPDSNPMDQLGHGTHVASTAAGLAVEGTSLAQGVAPGAELYALKIFGIIDSTQLLPLALEWCAEINTDGNPDNDVDIVNLSLGSNFGAMDANAPEIELIENLATLGTVVVAASGNAGNVQYVTSAPAIADSAISVAATTSSGIDDDLMADFSSRGPRGYDSALKPEISAPGTAILAAEIGTDNQGVSLKGTSMATPHVAGVAALVRQAHPKWTADQVKAAIMNTAVDLGHEIPLMGSGRVDALRAVTTDTLAVGDPKLVSLSWGLIEFNQAIYTATKSVTVTNFSDTGKTYSIVQTWGESSYQSGATFSLPESIDVPAGKSSSFTVELQLDAAEINEWVADGDGLEDYYGFIILQNPLNSDDILGVPFYILPKLYGEIIVTDFSVDHATANAEISHQGFISTQPEVWPVYLVDNNEPEVLDYTDLRMVMMDYDAVQDVIVFGFNIYSLMPNPFPSYGTIFLFLDVNQDDIDDYVFLNYGQNLIGVIDLDIGWDEIYIGSPYDIIYNPNSGLMFWPLPPEWYGLGTENSKISFCAASMDFAGTIDYTSCSWVDYLQRPFNAQLEPQTLVSDSSATLTLRADSVAGNLYNRPLGAAIVNPTGKAGVGEVTFLPFEFDFYETYTPLIMR